jgi:hypothetical protein
MRLTFSNGRSATMLARTFRTAKELKISEIERQAALTLLDMLERGKLKYEPMRREILTRDNRRWHYRKKNGETIVADRPNPLLGHLYLVSGEVKPIAERVVPHAGGFNIGWWGDESAGDFCGCHGGWMERIKGRELSERCLRAFDDLFEPRHFSTHPEHYTPERCARALHAKLTTGKADWS